MKSKTKKTPERIREDIIKDLSDGPKNVHEISENINSNWLTTEKFLNELIAEGRIIELISAAKSKIYASKEDLSFFYLPLRKDVRDHTISLLYTLNKAWGNQVDRPIQRTVLQKLAVEFVEKNQLQDKVPIARFHYGQTLLLRYEEETDFKMFDLDEAQKKSLSCLVEKYKSLTANKARLQQYKKNSMKFYSDKEEVINYFCIKEKKSLSKSLFNMMASYPTELMESFDFFDRIIYCVSVVINSTEPEVYLSRLKEVFTFFWSLITTEAFFKDVEASIAEGKEGLFRQIRANYMNTKKIQVSNVLDDIENEINLLEIDEDIGTSDLVHELLDS